MEVTRILDIFREGISVAIRLGAPILLSCLLVGVIVAIMQAVTQIHEQSIGLVIKLVVVVIILSVGGGWMLESLQEYTYSIFQMML